MRPYRAILAAPLAALAACGGPNDADRVVADNVEFLPEEALLNDVEGQGALAANAAAANANSAGGETPAVIPEPARPAPPPSPLRRPPSPSPKTVPDARPIIDPPPLERPDISVGPGAGNISNGQ